MGLEKMERTKGVLTNMRKGINQMSQNEKSKRNKTNKLKKGLLGIYATLATFLMPTTAYAIDVDTSAISAFTSAAGTLIGVVGGAGFVAGCVTIGESLGENGDKANLKKGIMQCCGGALIGGAGAYFATLG